MIIMTTPNPQVYVTLTAKFFVKSELAVGRVLGALELLERAPFFEGLSCFDYIAWFPQRGPQKSAPASASAIENLRSMVANRSVRSFGMGVTQGEHRFRFNEVAFSFPRADQDDEEVSELQLYIEEGRLSETSWPVIRECFRAFLEVLTPNYAFSATHVDAPDTAEVEREYERRLAFQPVDSLNDNRYVWDSDKLIRDVGWLNFLSQAHLSTLGPDAIAICRAQQWAIDVSGGLAFGIGESPFGDYRAVLQGLRSGLAPITCPR